MTALRKILIGLGAIFAVLIALALVRIVVLYIDRPDDEERIERAIEAYYGSTDPEACDNRTTAAYRLQRWGGMEPFARATCEAEAPTSASAGVEVLGIEVDGDRATAVVRFDGDSLDGSTVRIALAHEDDYWRLDRMLGFVEFDRAGARRAYRDRLLQFGSPRSATRCVAKEEAHYSDTELERAIVNSVAGTFAPIVVRCDRRGVERNLMSSVAAADADLTATGLDCAERQLAQASEAELARLSTSIPAYIALLDSCDPNYLAEFVRGDLADHDEEAGTIRCVAARLESLPLREATAIVYDRDRYDGLIGSCDA
ncbi:MAG TPA: hypothetical protein VIT85_01105 [Solirubrobacterales bacterium]